MANLTKVIVVDPPANARKVVPTDDIASGNVTMAIELDSGLAEKVMLAAPGELGEKMFFVSQIPEHYLGLEGDQSGLLLLEGDQNGFLTLQGAI